MLPEKRRTNLLWQPFDRDLKTVEQVSQLFADRAKARTTLFYNKVSDLGIRWLDQGPEHSQSGYYARIDGKDMLLTQNAIATGSRLVKASTKFWEQFPDKNAFPTTMAHILNTREKGAVQVRHDGIRVNAILHEDYIIKDVANFIDAFFPAIEENIGEISGISVREDGDNDIASLLVMLGDNLLPSVKRELGQNMMWSIRTSETGAVDTQTMMGLFRTICLNSATRIRQNSVWSHKGSWDTFWDGSMATIREFSYYADQFSKIFESLIKTPLDMAAADIIAALYGNNLITKAHSELAIEAADLPTEDNRAVETHYDLFNLLTRTAQDLPTLIAHERAASKVMEIFTRPGGLRESLRNGIDVN